MSKHVDFLIEEHEELQDKLNLIEQEAQSYRNERQVNKETEKNNQTLYDDLQNQIENIKGELQRKINETESLYQERSDNLQNIKRLDNENDDLKHRVADLIVSVIQSKTQRLETNLKNERENFTKTVDSLKKEYSELSSKGSVESENRITQLNKVISQYQHDIRILNQKIQEFVVLEEETRRKIGQYEVKSI